MTRLPRISRLLTFAVLAIFLTTEAAPSDGCGNDLLAGQSPGGASQLRYMTLANGTQRTYKIYIPQNYNKTVPAPIIISYHGRGESGALQEGKVKLSQSAFNKDYIAVYPDGIKAEWQGDPDAVGFDDIGFTMELLALLKRTYCIDTSRILANGHSNGAGFTGNILPCDSLGATTFAAFGIGSSAAYIQSPLNYADNCTTNGMTPDIVPIICTPGVPVRILEFHGTSDGTIAYTGGQRRSRCLPSIPHLMTNWAILDGLGSSNSSMTITVSAKTAIKYEWGTGSTLGMVTHYAVSGLGHDWPTTATAPFEATTILLAWFQKWAPGDGIPFNAAQWSSTRASTTASSTTGEGVFPTSTATISCPGSDGLIFTTSSGKQFLVECSHDYSGYDLTSGSYGNMASCIEACAIRQGCLAVSYVGTCYMKTQWTQGYANNANVIGARQYIASNTLTSSTTSSSRVSTSIVTNTASTVISSVTLLSSSTALMSSSAMTSSNPGFSTSESSIISASSSTSSTATSTTTSMLLSSDSAVSSSSSNFIASSQSTNTQSSITSQSLVISTLSMSTTLSSSPSSSPSSSAFSTFPASSSTSSASSSTSSASSVPSSSTVIVAVTSSISSESTNLETSSSSTPVSSTLSVPVSATTQSQSSALATTSGPNASNPTCPAADGTAHLSGMGNRYFIRCGLNATGEQAYPFIMNVGSFSKCLRYCDRYASCIGAAYLRDCYLLRTVVQYLSYNLKDDTVVRLGMIESASSTGTVTTLTAA